MEWASHNNGWSRIRTCEGSATRFTVLPLWPLGYPPGSNERPWDRRDARVNRFGQDRGGSFAKTTLQSRAGGESRTHNRRFTKPVLCRLSYASDHEAVKLPSIPSNPFQAREFSPRNVNSRDRLHQW